MPESLKNIPVLCYHKIDPRREWGLNCVTPERFGEQMYFLKENGYTPINFRQVRENRLPAHPLIITFDDGYESVAKYALPVLQALKFTAVVFVITGFIGKMNTWDINLGGIRFRHLNEQQLVQLSMTGIEIGSHGHTHQSLTGLGAAEVHRELNDSRRILKSITGMDIITFAYPFGRSTPSIHCAVAEAGYSYGCGNAWSPAVGMQTNLPRLPVYRTDSLGSFRRKISSGWKHKLEKSKLRLLSWPARLTPIYQKLDSRQYAAPYTENLPDDSDLQNVTGT